MCTCRHGRVPAVGYLYPIAEPHPNRHGRVPVVGFSRLTMLADIWSKKKVATALARGDSTSSAHTYSGLLRKSTHTAR